DAWLPETMAPQFESLAVWRRVSHEGVGRLGQCVYSISGETQSRHCWWLMLAISLAHSMSGDAQAGHTRSVASLLAAARRRPSGLNATLVTASVWPVSGLPRGWPVSAPHSRTVASSLALASRCAPGAKRTPHTHAGGA